MNGQYRESIQIPLRLKELLSKAPAIEGQIISVTSDFSDWFSDNKMPFFSGFTDHGVSHITNVLFSAESLVSEKSWQQLTPGDAGAIIASVLLHDSAMHLSIDGFLALIDGGPTPSYSRFIQEDVVWSDEFHAFLHEAHRWDEGKLVAVLGDAEPISNPLVNRGNFTERDKLVIGEFVRRNHARLAHQFAVLGLPRVIGHSENFHPFKVFGNEHKDLYGYLARSHNLNIRDAVDHLPGIAKREYLNVHAPLIMALLRISDFIQIDSKRAPVKILQIRSLRSPISRNEWAKHHAILDLNDVGDDPEAYNVIATPENVEIFVGLKSLFKEIQRELDETWAVLGEVYGRFSGLCDLGLTIRRLKSNLDDLNQFERRYRPRYVPRAVRLDTASAELLHLLVRPLYGNNPSVGVRELIQNSVDATLERLEYYKKHSHKGGKEYRPKIDVTVKSDEDKKGVEVVDNGVGMSLDTIENYFLRVGASFRHSDWWKQEYSNDSGSSKVRRSGRFGIGALAAFLIGNRVTITTRHFLSDDGYGHRFSMQLQGSLVEISRVPAEIGTKIEVEVNNDWVIKSVISPERGVAFNEWFIFCHPEITYRIEKQGESKIVEPALSLSEDYKSKGWTALEAPGFEKIYWSYSAGIDLRSEYGSRYICCNGIYISSKIYGAPGINISTKNSPISADHPTLVVYDKDGRLPLNIQRNHLAEDVYPFQDELEISISKNIVKELSEATSVAAVAGNIDDVVSNVAEIFTKHSNYREYRHGDALVTLSEKGWLPGDPEILNQHRPKWAVIEFFNGQTTNSACSNLKKLTFSSWLLIPCIFRNFGNDNIKTFFRGVLQGNHWRFHNPITLSGGEIECGCILARNDLLPALDKQPVFPQYLRRLLTESPAANDWTEFRFGKNSSCIDLKEIKKAVALSDSRLLVVCKISDKWKDVNGKSQFANQWNDLKRNTKKEK